MIMRTMIRRMLGLVMITEVAFILLAVFANVFWGTAFVTYNTRGFGREVEIVHPQWQTDKDCQG